MAARSGFEHRKRELQVALMGRVAGRAFSRRTTGLDGIAKRLLAKQAPPLEHDPELDHPDQPERPEP